MFLTSLWKSGVRPLGAVRRGTSRKRPQARRLRCEALEAREMLNGNSLLETLSNPTPAASDQFGYSVGVSGNTVVVGTPYDDTGATNAGSAYVFDAATGNLLHTLSKPTPAASDRFGNMVAVSGNTVVVGTPYDDTGATDAGSAYVFDAATGNLLRTLNNPTPAAGDQFGYSVAVSGSTVVLGTPYDDTGATDSGSAYIFDAATGNLLHTLDNPTPAANDVFGYSVAVSGSTVVVGASLDDTGAANAGSAYVFDAATGNLLRTLSNPTPAAGDQFGQSVAVSGSTVVVGASEDDTGATSAGSAYIFDTATGNLLHTLNNPSPATTDCFGNSVAVSGGTVVVGAHLDDTGATDSGSAYVFDGATGNLLHTLDNPTPAASDRFGLAVAVSGSTVVVGASLDDTGATNAGSAYVFDAAVDDLPWAAGLSPTDDATGAALNANLVIMFSESIQKLTGSVVIRSAIDDSVVETIDVSSPRVTVSGSTATIDRSATLAYGTGYYVEVTSGAFEDLTGNDFAGISGATAWNFITGWPLDSIPALNSNPGAPASLYLDFNGHFQPVWSSYTNIVTPVYDVDGDETTFSDAELANIQAVWEMVAEDYAPFDINVTTVEPSVLAPGVPSDSANKVAMRVAIGAEVGDWAAGCGIAQYNSFTNSLPNVVYVFTPMTLLAIGQIASHEAGHSFGLYHQDPGGVPIGRYIMSSGTLAFNQCTWATGTNTSGVFQDDMAVLANSTNGFGYRSDDHGDTIGIATPLAQVGNTWSGAGIVGTNADVDVLSFSVTTEHTYRIAVTGNPVAPNLDIVLELRNAAGQVIACANPPNNPQNTQNAEIVKNLAPGDYYLSVMSTGIYGRIGQYTVSIDDAPCAGISATTTSRTVITGEDGRQTSFAVELQTQPTADVTVAISSGDTTEGTVSTSSLTFTPANWNVPQTITVTGVDDTVTDGDVVYTVVLAASSSDPAYNALSPTQATMTNIDNDTKFYVVNDASQNQTYEYNATGGPVESSSLTSGNTAPRGVATTIAGDKVWVVDANRKVYVYNNASGGLLGSWTAGSLPSSATVEDITVWGNDVWIVDAKSDKVYRYSGAASRLSGSQNATSSFSLNSGNTSPKGMVTDGTYLWVVNDSTTDKVFKYTLSGQLVGSWQCSGTFTPTGITINPADVSDIWIVDSSARIVWRYAAAAGRTSGSQGATVAFALAAGNTNPQGIADPPAPAVSRPSERRATASLRPEAAAVDYLMWDLACQSSGREPSTKADHDLLLATYDPMMWL